jgi:hypothetical protein
MDTIENWSLATACFEQEIQPLMRQLDRAISFS